jgi:hypothetical protein
MPELAVSHTLFYNTEQPVPAWQVANALLSLQALAVRTSFALEDLFEGTSIQAATVYLDTLETGSLIERFFIRFVFGDQQRFDDFVDKPRTRLGFDQPSERKLVAAMLLLLMLAGYEYAVKVWRSDSAAKAIQINQNIVINAGSEASGLSPEAIRKAIAAASAANPATLANDALRLLSPAKTGGASSIRLDDDPTLQISPDVISSMPSQILPERPFESMRDFENVEIEIRATDLDSSKRGWGVRVPSISSRRMPMEIGLDVNPRALASGATVKGNITVAFEGKGSEQPTAKRVYLKELVNPRQDTTHSTKEPKRYKTIGKPKQ